MLPTQCVTMGGKQDHAVEAVLFRFLQCKVILFPLSMLFCLKGGHYVQPSFKGEELEPLRELQPHTLIGILLLRIFIYIMCLSNLCIHVISVQCQVYLFSKLVCNHILLQFVAKFSSVTIETSISWLLCPFDKFKLFSNFKHSLHF